MSTTLPDEHKATLNLTSRQDLWYWNIRVVVLQVPLLHTCKQENATVALVHCQNVNNQDVNHEKCAWLEGVLMELATQVAPGVNTSETDL